MIELKIKRLSETAKMPTRENSEAMWSLYSDCDIELNSHQPSIIKLGLAMEIPEGYRIKVYSTSSLPLKLKVLISSGTGIVDTGHRTEIELAAHTIPDRVRTDLLEEHLKSNIVKIEKGAKVAQFCLEKILDFEIKEV